ncbi:AGRD1-like protein [Mya arenaria]|uniref:AGRD1-like protein n=1 Tax=Mya arenaria TaxID=6604 RepID=A0ABY7EGQ4_MYAAR|nr:AGRD1-like protein [Mya arenaria]
MTMLHTAGIRSIAILIPVFGLTWIFGVFAINEATLVFQWLYVILNTLQGVMIFVVKCVMDRKIRKEFLECWRRRTRDVSGFSSSIPNKVSKDETGKTTETDL